MKNNSVVRINLRLSKEDFQKLKSRSTELGLSCNSYIADLINKDALNLSTNKEWMKTLDIIKTDCDHLRVHSYVILKLATALLSFNYHRDPSDEGIVNAIKFLEQKLAEARSGKEVVC